MLIDDDSQVDIKPPNSLFGAESTSFSTSIQKPFISFPTSRGRFIGVFTEHVNLWSLCKIRYFMYLFSKIGIVLNVGTHALRRLNASLGLRFSY